MSRLLCWRGTSPTRRFRWIEQPVSPPADTEKPGMRECNRANSVPTPESSLALSPAFEPAARRSRIDRPGSKAHSVSPRVEQHIPDRIPDLVRRLQNPHVIPVRQELAAPRERPLCRTHHSHGNRLHSPSQCVAALGLDDEMGMVPQESVVHQPKLPALAAPRKRLFEGANETPPSQRRHTVPNPECHVARVTRCEGRPTAVTDHGVRTRLSSRPLTPAAMTRQRP